MFGRLYTQESPKNTPIYIKRESSDASNTWFRDSNTALEYFNPGVALDATIYGIPRRVTYLKCPNKHSDLSKAIIFYVIGSHFPSYPESYLKKFMAELNPNCRDRVLVVTSEIKSDASESTDLEPVSNLFQDPLLAKLPIVKFRLPQHPPEKTADIERDEKIAIFGALTRLAIVKPIMTSSARRRNSNAYNAEGDVVAGQILPKGDAARVSVVGRQVFAEDLMLTPEEEARFKAAEDAAKEQAAKARGVTVEKPVGEEENVYWEGWDSRFSEIAASDIQGVQTMTLTDEEARALANQAGNHYDFSPADLEEELPSARRGSDISQMFTSGVAKKETSTPGNGVR